MYAVLQLDLTPPPVEALTKAFAQTQLLRPTDAAKAVRDAFGILAERLPAPDALAVSQALGELGVATDVVDDKDMPTLPPPKLVSRIECRDAGLAVFSAIGRETLFDWSQVALISVGRVGMIDMVSQQAQYFQVEGLDNYAWVRSNSRYAEKERQHLLLDVIVQGPERYRADATKLNFAAMGSRLQPTAAANFGLLVTDLISRAAGAVLNQGAQALRDGREFFYPNRHAFEEETIWQMWKAARS